ncbi:hypothetical protein N7495_001553 [Penicillium taxi]|uniref:uncharacterized protein n=1 Tax=Penicillium taxi TaxID=168475 RepID=UPI002545A15A|nr:uncharacterized protein N7495_001553 [Penicillium taxi]KAJ5908871.1 hypothetical protein N7495_001553 [Penicillium taxi]
MSSKVLHAGISKRPDPKAPKTPKTPNKLDHIKHFIDQDQDGGNLSQEQDKGARVQPSNTDIPGHIQSGNFNEAQHAGESVAQSIEPPDTEMEDKDSISQDPGQSKKPTPEQASQLQRHEIKPASLKDSILDDSELLADLRSLSLNEDSDATADGWGIRRGSKFCILQYGPRQHAMFKAKYT